MWYSVYIPLRYVEHGRWVWLSQFAAIYGPQSAKYSEERALATAIGTSD